MIYFLLTSKIVLLAACQVADLMIFYAFRCTLIGYFSLFLVINGVVKCRVSIDQL